MYGLNFQNVISDDFSKTSAFCPKSKCKPRPGQRGVELF